MAYDVCSVSGLLISPCLGKVDRTQFQPLCALGICLLRAPSVLAVVEVENGSGDEICLLVDDGGQAYFERPLRLSTGLASVSSFGTSPCNHRRHLRGEEIEAAGLFGEMFG